MDNPQYYQPLSHALHAPLVSASHTSPRQSYAHYAPHQQHPVTNGAGSGHREEEEEEEDDDDEVVEEEVEHHGADHPRQSASSHSSPRVNAAQTQSSSTGPASATASADYRQAVSQQERAPSATNDDATEKRKPGRPRGSRNRKPRVSSGSATKAPANSQHPGFYQYPPAPDKNISQQNQQFYEFQWRALNLCSEFYNAAEELVKAASPMVIAQCYQLGPSSKVDPLLMIADAKRVCDNLLANPSQLVGQPVPAPTYPSYSSMPPPPPPGAAAAAGPAPTAGSVITNPQTFVMPLNSSVPPPPQPYYPAVYAPPPGSRYPTAPYYYPPPQGATPYYPASAPPAPAASPPAVQASAPAPAPAAAPPPPPVPAPVPTTTPQPAPQASPPTPSPAIPTNTGTISTFSAATGNVAPGGHQGTWSEEETDRLKRLAEQSREMGGGQNKGEIEWVWEIQQWGNSRTRHQILLKATALGLKESSTRGTKRRRELDSAHTEAAHPPPPPPQQQQQQQQQHVPPPSAPASAVSPTRSPMNSTPTSINASPAMQPQRPPSQSTNIMPPPRTAAAPAAPPPTTASNLPWPLPTMASSSSIIPSPTPPAPATGTDSTNY
ncbi:hypothetical protein BD309DRAFT_986211 [Dichomitus squalens]|nr:hypothetical protein BD309DRAFT_986211 [Dichomitus squalens]